MIATCRGPQAHGGSIGLLRREELACTVSGLRLPRARFRFDCRDARSDLLTQLPGGERSRSPDRRSVSSCTLSEFWHPSSLMCRPLQLQQPMLSRRTLRTATLPCSSA
jgi:hypothetical protein